MSDLGPVVPLRFDLSDLVRKSVATLYSHLVTRPTGQALRLGIESQITELGTVCLTVLDFSEVVVLDYSCAEETVAKLIHRFQREDRPSEAFFIVRGIDDRHRETIESVLGRQGLAIAAEPADGEATVIGHVSDRELTAWRALEELRHATAAALADRLNASEAEMGELLERLAHRRVVARMETPRTYFALRPLLTPG
ncbi:MAG TPA: hypothetical protein VMM83_07090 [Longimicrobiales bacterium]|nr:hypothetical protein [Longimicrobiales bacterium]